MPPVENVMNLVWQVVFRQADGHATSFVNPSQAPLLFQSLFVGLFSNSLDNDGAQKSCIDFRLEIKLGWRCESGHWAPSL